MTKIYRYNSVMIANVSEDSFLNNLTVAFGTVFKCSIDVPNIIMHYVFEIDLSLNCNALELTIIYRFWTIA